MHIRDPFCIKERISCARRALLDLVKMEATLSRWGVRKRVARLARDTLQERCQRLLADNIHLRARLQILADHAAHQSGCYDVPRDLQELGYD